MKRDDTDGSADPARSPKRNKESRLGDLMGGELGYSTSDLKAFAPLQRVVLTANGNLQRIVSSYYNAEVLVVVRHNRRVAHGQYHRQVDIKVFDTVICRATTKVNIDRDDLIKALEDGVALGQLFREFDLLPTFELRAAGRVAPREGGPTDPTAANADEFDALPSRFWRDYTLAADGFECLIHEDMRGDLFELSPPPTAATDEVSRTGVQRPSFGDIMLAGANTYIPLPDGFTPLQRILMSANGNVERVVSSFHARPVQTYVVVNHAREGGLVYDRQVALLLDGRQLMCAKTTCFLTDPQWAKAVNSDGIAIGGLFAHFQVLPMFTLHSAGRLPTGFWRQYQLRSTGLTCEINETFDDSALQLLDTSLTQAQSEPEPMYGSI